MYASRINMGTLLPFYRMSAVSGTHYPPTTDVYGMHRGGSDVFQAPWDRLMPFIIPVHVPTLVPPPDPASLTWVEESTGAATILDWTLFDMVRASELDANGKYGYLAVWLAEAGTGLDDASFCGQLGRLVVWLEGTMTFIDGQTDMRRAVSHRIRLISSGLDVAPARNAKNLLGYEPMVLTYTSDYAIQGHTMGSTYVVNPPDGYSERFYFDGYMAIPELEREEELLINRLGHERVMSATTRTRAQLDMADVPYGAMPSLGRIADFEDTRLWRQVDTVPYPSVTGAGGNLWGIDLREAYPTITFTPLNNDYARGRLSWTQERVFKTSCALV